MDKPTTYLDLIDLVDKFPYDDVIMKHYYRLLLPHDNNAHGFIRASTVNAMPWTDGWRVDHTNRTIIVEVPGGIDEASTVVTQCFKEVIDAAIQKNVFRCLAGRHSELFSVPGAPYPVKLERFATSLFGTITRGAHLTGYTYRDGQLMLWVPRRSQNVGTWKGMLDSTVAGGVAADESPFENIVREAAEEASLPASLVREKAQQTGVLTYMGLSGGENGWEADSALPDAVYVYDMELPADVIPTPCDDEVKEFMLMDVQEVKRNMLARQFKPNCAVIMLYFFIRRGLITLEDERDYEEIVQRMHRRLPFPLKSKA